MKKLHKVLALLLASIMLLGTLAACTKDPDPGNTGDAQVDTSTPAPNNATSPPETAVQYTDYSGGFGSQVTIRIPVYDRGHEGWNLTDNTYTRWVQEEFGNKYNIKVEYVAIGRQTQVADYRQMFAAGNAPHIIFNYDMPVMVNYYGDGMLMELDLGELAYYAPNFYGKNQTSVLEYGEMENKTMFYFANRPTMYYQYVTLIRQDWLDAVGMDIPNSQEEYNAVLMAWKEAGLGTRGDAPLLTSGFTFYNAFIGADYDYEELALYLDLSVAPLTWQATEEYLRNLNYQYNNGLLDPEFYLKNEDAKNKADFVAGKTGTYGMYLASNTDVISGLVANNPGAKVAILNGWSIVPEGNNPYYYEYLPFGFIQGINSTSTDEERIAVWMFLEWLNEAENLFKFQFGVEGDSYDFDENGLAIRTPDYDGDWKVSPNNNKDYWALVEEAIVYADFSLTHQSNVLSWGPPGYEYLVEESYQNFLKWVQYGIVSPIFSAVIESSGEYSADLNTLWQQLYVKIVTEPEADFDKNYAAACQEYLDAGYQKILDEKQDLINNGRYN